MIEFLECFYNVSGHGHISGPFLKVLLQGAAEVELAAPVRVNLLESG